MKKYSVLTCIFGYYEHIREVVNPDPEVEYVLVTDNGSLQSTTWSIVPVDPFVMDLSPNGRSVYVKYHPFEYVHTNTVLWVDGSVNIKDGYISLMDNFLHGNALVGEVLNLMNNDPRNESNRWLNYQYYGYNQEMRDRLHSYLDKRNYHSKGMVQTTIYMCKNNPISNHINSMTWDLVNQFGSGGDIIREYMGVRSYVLSQNLFRDPRLWVISPTLLWCKWFDYCNHRTNNSQLDNFINSGTLYYPEDKNILRNWVFEFQDRNIQPILPEF